MDVFPVAVGVADPQPRVERLAGDWLTANRVHSLCRSDVRHTGRLTFAVENAYARINQHDSVLTASWRLVRNSMVKAKLLESFAFLALPVTHISVLVNSQALEL